MPKAKDGYVPIQDGTIPQAINPVLRQTDMAFSDWSSIVLEGGKRHATEKLLQSLYAKGWEATACAEYMLDWELYSERPKARKPRTAPPYQRKALILEDAQKRVAKAAYVAIAGLVVKNTTPEAKAWLVQAQAYYRKILEE